MRLDRNVGASGRGKYGIVSNRRLQELLKPGPNADYLPQKIASAVKTLEDLGILDWGVTPDTEFFVIKLRDKNASHALLSYARAANIDDPEYANDVFALAQRANDHPHMKKPD